MGKAIMIYKDKAGNKVYKRIMKTRRSIQLTAKNKQGRLINPIGTGRLLAEARRAGKLRF